MLSQEMPAKDRSVSSSILLWLIHGGGTLKQKKKKAAVFQIRYCSPALHHP